MFERPDFTPRNVAKFVVRTVIHGKTAQITRELIVDHSDFENDDMTVRISGNLVGWYVSAKLKPHTDKMVDKTADFIVAKREARAANKKDKPPSSYTRMRI
jgi:hypothetical protein